MAASWPATSMRPLGGRKFAILLLLIGTALVGCSRKDRNSAAPAAPDVSVAYPVQKEVVEWDTYTGYLQAPEMASVAARVNGMIMEMPFDEGSIVKRGDVLATIDDRPFKAELEWKEADARRAEAALSIANVTFDRLAGLQKGNAGAVSQQDLDNARAQVEQMKAAVAASKALVETARLNLEWCRVLSPIDGRVSNKLVTVGNLVNGGANGMGQATMLTTVQSVSPIYCYVDIDEQSILKYQKLAAERALTSARDGKMPCFVRLGDESSPAHKGVIDFLDNHVDTTTGTMRMRGIMENQDGTLIPGMFARLSVPGSGRYKAVLVPDTAIGNDQSQRNVLVVDNDNKVAIRPVTLGALFGELRSITSGISADDRIVVNGQMHARPGSAVSPIETSIKVDESAFADPGLDVAGKSSTDNANAAGTEASATARPLPAGAAAGTR